MSQTNVNIIFYFLLIKYYPILLKTLYYIQTALFIGGTPTEPGTTQPGTTKPGTTKPGMTEPGTTFPESDLARKPSVACLPNFRRFFSLEI
jgi:hypothetical protein